MTLDELRYRAAAERICRLWRDLRLQAEAWSAGEEAPEIAERNPDVDIFNGATVGRSEDRTSVIMLDLVAAILKEQLG